MIRLGAIGVIPVLQRRKYVLIVFASCAVMEVISLVLALPASLEGRPKGTGTKTNREAQSPREGHPRRGNWLYKRKLSQWFVAGAAFIVIKRAI
jgi:hypothetical protein